MSDNIENIVSSGRNDNGTTSSFISLYYIKEKN